MMACTDRNTKSRHFTHLTEFQRGQIQALYHLGYSLRRIGQEIGCTHQTVSNELKRGTVTQIGPNHKRFQAYFPETGQIVYETHRQHCGRHYKLAEATEFMTYAEEKMQSADHWSPDAVCGAAERDPDWQGKVRVCTQTLYHYIDLGLLKVRNIDLPRKLRLRPKKTGQRPNLKHLGESIENRPAEVDSRKTFGNWEIDTVVGQKTADDDVLLTLVERKSRLTYSTKIDGKDPGSVHYALKQLKGNYGSTFKRVFQTITADNGSEFAGLADALKGEGTKVYYTHPYSSWERGTNERHNEMIRRFIPKGKAISDYSRKFIQRVVRALNHLPRRILGYRTPTEAFEEEIQALIS